jgi:hypothetical protein
VRSLFKTFAPDFEPRDGITDLWLTAGLLLWAEAGGSEERRDVATTIFNEIMVEVPLNCPQCGAHYPFAPVVRPNPTEHNGTKP